MVDPVAPAASAAGGVFRSLLPERSVEDVLAGMLRMKFGESSFNVPVLVIEKADEWRAGLITEAGSIMSSLETQTNASAALIFLSSHTDTMLALIRKYDIGEVLPDDAWMRSHATEPEVLRAFMLVMAACFPFVASALDILAANPSALKMVLAEFMPGKQTLAGLPRSTSPEPTAGPTNRRARRSLTSSSKAT